MIPIIGSIALVVVLCFSFLQSISVFVKRVKFQSVIKHSSFIILGLMILSFGCLLAVYILSDFSVLNVYLNSHTQKPMLYKITGAWGNHEGSMLLFLLLLTVYSFLYDVYTKNPQKRYVLAGQAFIIFCIASYTFFLSNPFVRIFPVPVNGQGLNPLLQDIGLAIHPPLLYLGYTGFSLALSAAIAGLCTGKVNAAWAKDIQSWVLIAWGFLTLGIGLGSWWAYRELGWGGFWFWDPVENSSLLPWLSATALLHSLLVLRKRDTLKKWTSLLAIATFTLSLIGFFLVRSGILNSVHAFANDPYRGSFILLIVCVIGGGGLFIFARHAGRLKDKHGVHLLSKEGGILMNNLLIVTLCSVVFLGVLYPIMLDIIAGHKVSVGLPYYKILFTPIALFILFLAAIAPNLNWKKEKKTSVLLKKFNVISMIALLTGILLWYAEGEFNLAVIGLPFAVWLFFATLSHFMRRVALTSLKALPRSFIGMTLAHAGIAILAASVISVNQWEEEKELFMQVGEKTELAGFSIKLEDVNVIQQENYLAQQSHFLVRRKTGMTEMLMPESRIYLPSGRKTTESAIIRYFLHDLYITTGEGTSHQGVTTRIFYRPFINGIWFGVLLIALGGWMSVPRKRRRSAKKRKAYA